MVLGMILAKTRVNLGDSLVSLKQDIDLFKEGQRKMRTWGHGLFGARLDRTLCERLMRAEWFSCNGIH